MRIGFILFPALTQLDLTGPWEVLTRLPHAECYLISQDVTPVQSATGGLRIVPNVTYADCPQLDIVCVPGGPGHLDAMEDQVLLDFLRHQAPRCRYVSAVCTGTLILAAAGLMQGYRATTHWSSLERLSTFGSEPVRQRVVIDRDRITGGGVTAGIDFGLSLAAEVAGEALAREIQLQLEYEPAPPYGGSPDTADERTVTVLRSRYASRGAQRQEVDARAAARLQQKRILI